MLFCRASYSKKKKRKNFSYSTDKLLATTFRVILDTLHTRNVVKLGTSRYASCIRTHARTRSHRVLASSVAYITPLAFWYWYRQCCTTSGMGTGVPDIKYDSAILRSRFGIPETLGSGFGISETIG